MNFTSHDKIIVSKITKIARVLILFIVLSIYEKKVNNILKNKKYLVIVRLLV